MTIRISKDILRLTLLFLSVLIVENSHSSEDRGWSSSGGGEYIVTEKNPWFLGNSPVTWCISHGGDDQFSLSLTKSKKEIESAISNLSKQLKSLNMSSGFMSTIGGPLHGIPVRGVLYPKNTNEDPLGNFYDFFYRFTMNSDFKKNAIAISENYNYIENCQEAELEFILGDTHHPKIRKLIDLQGLRSFKNLLGIAMRTNYSSKTFRAKGFIYIAADKGPNKYSGSIFKLSPNKEIWNFREELKAETPFPSFTYFFHHQILDSQKVKMKENTVGLLEAVVAHEFGHTLGFQHTTENDIMNIDYPAKSVSRGYVTKGGYLRRSKIIARSKITSLDSDKMYFDWSNGLVNSNEFEGIKESSPELFDFFFDEPSQEMIFEVVPKVWSFNISRFERGKSSFTSYRIGTSLNLIKAKEFKIEMDKTCDLPTKIFNINLRRTITRDQDSTWQLVPETQEWRELLYTTEEAIQTDSLISFMNHNTCGSMILTDTTRIKFKLIHDYFGNSKAIFSYNGKQITTNLIPSNISPQDEIQEQKLWPQLESYY